MVTDGRPSLHIAAISLTQYCKHFIQAKNNRTLQLRYDKLQAELESKKSEVVP